MKIFNYDRFWSIRVNTLITAAVSAPLPVPATAITSENGINPASALIAKISTAVTPIKSISPSTADSNGTIKLGVFNLHIFGTTKASKPEVMGVLSKIIRNHDAIAIQEIRDSSQTALPMLRDAVNSIGSP
jgi:hypothetical protein